MKYVGSYSYAIHSLVGLDNLSPAQHTRVNDKKERSLDLPDLSLHPWDRGRSGSA